MGDGGRAAEQALEAALPEPQLLGHRDGCRDGRMLKVRLKRVDPGIAVWERRGVRQRRDVVQVQVVVRVDQAGKNEVIAQIDLPCAGWLHRRDASRRDKERARDGAIRYDESRV